MNEQVKDWKAVDVARIDPAEARGTPVDKAPTPDLGTALIPKGRYTSRAFMELEWQRLWRKVWNLAGPEQVLEAPGDYFTTELGGESFIIVKQDDGTYKGFFNVCRHRGNRLCLPGAHGRAASFRCQYHHWEWNPDGTVKNIPDPESFSQGLPYDKLGLRQVRVDRWGGLIWFTMDPEAEPLADYLGVIPEHLDPYHFERQRLTKNVTIEWDCNWKTSVDAFNETYHVQGIHPELMSWLDDYHVQIDCYGRHNRYLVPFTTPSPRYQDRDSLSPEMQFMLSEVGLDPSDFDGRPLDVRRAIQQAKRAKENAVIFPYRELNDDQLSDDYHYMIFPNVTMNIYAESMMLFRSRPHPSDPNRMFFDLMNFAHLPDDADLPPPEHKTYKHGQYSLGLVLDQDAYNLPGVQAGMNSESYDGLYIGDQELRIRHFHKTLMDYVDPDGGLGL